MAFDKQKRWRKAQMEAGLCPHCGKPCAPGVKQCRDRIDMKRVGRILNKLAKSRRDHQVDFLPGLKAGAFRPLSPLPLPGNTWSLRSNLRRQKLGDSFNEDTSIPR